MSEKKIKKEMKKYTLVTVDTRVAPVLRVCCWFNCLGLCVGFLNAPIQTDAFHS